VQELVAQGRLDPQELAAEVKDKMQGVPENMRTMAKGEIALYRMRLETAQVEARQSLLYAGDDETAKAQIRELLKQNLDQIQRMHEHKMAEIRAGKARTGFFGRVEDFFEGR
jgi:hypothetical protein